MEELQLYKEIVSEITDAKPGKMFGAECFNAPNGKAVAFFYKGNMVFKLTGEDEKEALSLDGTQLFSPTGRAMGGWVQVPFDYQYLWKEMAVAAMKYVSGLPPNQKKKK